jgi:hypothetical protein
MTASGLPPSDIIKALKSLGVSTPSMSEEGYTDNPFDAGSTPNVPEEDYSGYTDNPFDASSPVYDYSEYDSDQY